MPLHSKRVLGQLACFSISARIGTNRFRSLLISCLLSLQQLAYYKLLISDCRPPKSDELELQPTSSAQFVKFLDAQPRGVRPILIRGAFMTVLKIRSCSIQIQNSSLDSMLRVRMLIALQFAWVTGFQHGDVPELSSRYSCMRIERMHALLTHISSLLYRH